ncbi:hypothetical protein D3C71_906760 [compost metagenome]
MKFQYYLFLSIALIAACSENKSVEKTIENKPELITKSGEKPLAIEPESVDFKRLNLDTLVSLIIMKEESDNIYEKFGIDFTGYCYACDVADLILNNEQIKIVNTCEPDLKKVFRIQNKSLTKDGFTLDAEWYKFVFSRIDNTPIYKLKLLGKPFNNPELRLNTYFTTPKALPKFEIHDCGDFQG